MPKKGIRPEADCPPPLFVSDLKWTAPPPPPHFYYNDYAMFCDFSIVKDAKLPQTPMGELTALPHTTGKAPPPLFTSTLIVSRTPPSPDQPTGLPPPHPPPPYRISRIISTWIKFVPNQASASNSYLHNNVVRLVFNECNLHCQRLLQMNFIITVAMVTKYVAVC